VQEGPKLKIRHVDFVGNKAFSDGELTRRMKTNKPKPWFNPFSGRGTWRIDRYEEDVERVGQHYRNNGFLQARIGQPEFKTLETSDDGKTRYVEMRVPVTEGKRYRIGEFDMDGNTVIKTQALRPLFEVKKGEFANEERIRKGLQRAQEAYGTGGYMEFTGYPDYRYRDEAPGQVPPALALVPASDEPIVDVTMRLNEGKQFFVNKITFVGNTTTRDNVIRREMQVWEGGVLNMEMLKYSVRRINQLGYFKQLEEQKVPDWVQKVEGKDNQVDLTVKLEEQNRNQITFGAGVSQFEGFFGQLSFQTSNFLGRGESLTVSMQAGSRAQQYQLGFTEPFLFDRNMTGGVDVYRRTVQYISQFTQVATGGNLTFGVPVAAFSRMFFQYSYEQVRVQDLNEAFFDSSCLFQARGCSEVSLDNLSSSQLLLVQRNPFLYDSLLIGQSGKRTVSKITPSFVHNTVDNPIFPNRGKRFTLSLDMAGLGGNTKYLKPRAEGIWFLQHTRRTSLGMRARIEYIKPYGSTQSLPIFERLYLGGEYDIRGYDIRTIGPSDPLNRGLVLGGNKSLLFNAEYLISIAGPVRLILFYDAGQVRDIGQSFAWKEDLTAVTFPDAPILTDPSSSVGLIDPNASRGVASVIGKTSAFKTSTGAEIRFFMPVLNVPFRLIFAANPQRGGVLDNSLRPAKDFTFKFAVGSTF
jgi:outer membrane protein insertion porin family